MKAQRTIITLGAVLAITLAGCDKPSEPNQPTSGGQSTGAANPAAEGVAAAVEAAKPAVEQAAKEVQAAANTAVAEATAKANALIDQTKKLISETKYPDAMNLINQLSSMKLTPEQEKLVADLKAQVQKALSSLSTTNVSGAIGNLLK